MNTKTFSTWLAGLALAAALNAAAAPGAHEEAITLATPTGSLAGTLMLPTEPRPVPVVLIIAGSGPTDRDGNNRYLAGPNNSLKLLAQALADAGYASVRYDKRGIGASLAAGPAEADLRFDGYVNDAAGWLDQLRADPRFTALVVLGHSEGSLIGMLAAQKSRVNAYVSLAGIAHSASDILRIQLAPKLPAALLAQNEKILVALEHGQLVEEVPPALTALYRPSVQPYLISWFKYLPSKELARLGVPVLIVQGDTDIQVQVSEAEGLKKALPSATLVVVPGMNHVLKMVAADMGQQLASYGDPGLPLSPALGSAIIAFLRGAHLP
ncbi:MAG: alpha/beta fold hydrolase [Pseudomonadota bacterium]